MSGPPLPGSALVTPPQVGKMNLPQFLPLSTGDIEHFFDRSRYQKPLTVLGEKVDTKDVQSMITTKENIRMFFNPMTYRRSHHHPQKRAAPPSEPSSAASVAPRAKAKMSKDDLLRNFKLAAELNGLSWDEMAVFQLY